MALTHLSQLVVILLVAAGSARATPAPAPTPTPTPAPAPTPGLVPPRPLTPPTVTYPADAPPLSKATTLLVTLTIATDGTVASVTPVPADTPYPPAALAAVIAAAKAFRFTPALFDGVPVAVEIQFSHTFLPPPADPVPDGPALDSLLRGRLLERGTHAPVVGATVAAIIDGETWATETDPSGRFRLPLPPGKASISVRAAGYRLFLQKETLAAQEELAVGYYIDAERYDPYEIVVHGDRPREEVSRLALRGHELKQVPGTFGDPFRVIQSLPGVASVVSLLPLPIVRGASPGSTGFLLDGVTVPLLYHLMAGPAVIHPEFIEEVSFYPGGFPASYGGYTAGIVDGLTHRARPDEALVDIDINLTQAGVLVRQPILGQTLTVAGRYGYPGPLLELASDGQASLSYWDYQVRLDGGTLRHGYTVFAFGASDTLEGPGDDDLDNNGIIDPAFETKDPPLEPVVTLRFHRIDLRFYQSTGAVSGVYRAVLGYDESITGATTSVRTLSIEPRLSWRFPASGCLELRAGLEGSFRDVHDLGIVPVDSDDEAMEAFSPGPTRLHGGAYVEALWRPVPELLVRPGLRTDLRWDSETFAPTVDPRLSLRYRLGYLALPDDVEPSDDDAVWLKGSIGLYHQPPRLFAPIPGVDELPLRYGQLAAIQGSLGVEIPLARAWRIEAETYYNAMDPVVFDLSINAEPGDVNPEEGDGFLDGDNLLDRFLSRQVGRAMGLEVMLRKRDTGKGLHGWLAYTLSLSQRRRDGEWVAFDFDRTHLVSAVGAVSLPRNWSLSMRLQFQSGKPVTTNLGYNAVRGAGFTRIDVRIDKHAVWNDWLLDFYIDLINIAVFPEDIGTGEPLRYVLPTLGVRGRF